MDHTGDEAAVRRADELEARRRRLEAGGPLDRYKAAFVGTPIGTINTISDVLDVLIVPATFLWSAYLLKVHWPRPDGWTWFAMFDFVVAVGFLVGKPHLRLQRRFFKRIVKRP